MRIELSPVGPTKYVLPNTRNGVCGAFHSAHREHEEPAVCPPRADDHRVANTSNHTLCFVFICPRSRRIAQDMNLPHRGTSLLSTTQSGNCRSMSPEGAAANSPARKCVGKAIKEYMCSREGASSARRFPMTAISMRGHLQLRQDFPERLPVVVLPSCCEMGALRQGSDDPRERRGCIDAWTRSPTANMILFNILTSWLPSCLWPAQGAGCENFSRQTLYRNGGSGKLQSQCTNSRAPRRRRRPVSGGRTTGP